MGRRLSAVLLCGVVLAVAPAVNSCAGLDTTATTPAPQHAGTTAAPVSEPEVAAGSETTGRPESSSSSVDRAITGSTSPAVDGSRWGEAALCEAVQQGVSVKVVLRQPENVPDAEMGMSDPELNRLVALPVAIQNLGEQTVTVVLDWFELHGSDGVVYRPAPLSDSPVALLRPGEVAPGGGIEGNVVFEVPEGVDIWSGACDVSLGTDPASRCAWKE